MATEEERRLEALSSELADRLIDAMISWRDDHDSAVDSRVPLGALIKVAVRCVSQITPERRQAYAEDFARVLYEHVGRKPS